MSRTNMVITIGRQYGSNGREIGRRLAGALDIKFYDKELLDHAANDSGICKELFENHDEKPTNSLLYSIVMDTYSFGYSSAAFTDMPMNHKVFLAQFDAIKRLAEEGPCVMVGRCADYALADKKNCMNIFIHADQEKRIRTIAKRYDISEAKAKDAVNKTDKSRSSYYNYYTNKRWGDARSYHLCVNSGVFGVDGSVELIIQALHTFERQLQNE